MLLDKAFPETKINARGGRVKLTGPHEEVLTANLVIKGMIEVAERKNSVSEVDVKTLIALKSGEQKAIPNKPVTLSDGKDVIIHTHTGDAVVAKTPGQRRIVTSSNNHDIVFAIGPAGTGKTYTSVALAVQALKERKVRKIILARPAVEAGENLGFLPGDLKEKIDPYLRPLYDALEDMIDQDRLELHLAKNAIEIAPLAYMRGRTLNNAFVILDEAQNATNTQMKMFLTRIGFNSRAIITGDVTQTDLPKKQESGLISIPNILKDINGIDFVYLGEEDVVRHKLVRDIIKAYDQYEEGK
ncbi:MAG: PhoH family protein [Balneolaceae bacterium]